MKAETQAEKDARHKRRQVFFNIVRDIERRLKAGQEREMRFGTVRIRSSASETNLAVVKVRKGFRLFYFAGKDEDKLVDALQPWRSTVPARVAFQKNRLIFWCKVVET